MAPRGALKWAILLALRFAVGGIFLWAGATKAWNPAGFAEEIEAYRLVPYRLGVAGAVYLPWLEMVAGAWLIFARDRRAAIATLVALLLLFIGALASAWARGLDIRCGCFGGAGASEPIVNALLRDVAMLGALAVVAWSERAGGREKRGESGAAADTLPA